MSYQIATYQIATDLVGHTHTKLYFMSVASQILRLVVFSTRRIDAWFQIVDLILKNGIPGRRLREEFADKKTSFDEGGCLLHVKNSPCPLVHQ